MKGLSTLIISWCNFHCSSIKQLAFIPCVSGMCVAKRFLSNLWKSVEMLCNRSGQPHALSWTTEIAVNAGECALWICAYDNEAGDAVVCLTVRGCIMQFIHLMRPTYLAILICFLGERSNISETTQSEPSFNKSARCPWLLEALFCFVEQTKKVQGKPSMFFQKHSNVSLKECNVVLLKNETKQNKVKQLTNTATKSLCRIWINVMCFKIERIFPGLLAQCALWNSWACICLRNQLLWCGAVASVSAGIWSMPRG